MPLIRLPSEHDASYAPARGPVLLLSCMDLRCLDEVIQFMDHDGLTNRYDHVILAGAALGALGGGADSHPHWTKTFFDHLEVALELHHIKDVYIVEHRDCGAYSKFLGAEGTFDDDDAKREAVCHKKYTDQLARRIEDWCQQRKAKLHVRAFLMDLRGRVAPIDKLAARRAKPAGRKST